NVARGARDLDVTAQVFGGNGAACRRKLCVAVDLCNVNGSGSRADFHRAAQVADVFCAGSDARIDLRLVRNLDLVTNRDIAHARKILANANRVAALLNGWVGNNLVQARLRILKSETGSEIGRAHV